MDRDTDGAAPQRPDVPAPGQLMTVTEVADTLRVSTMTVYRLVSSGELPGLRIGRNIRIRTRDLDAFLAAGTVARDETGG